MRENWSPDWLEDVSQDVYDVLRDNYMPEMPPLEWGEYLASLLLEFGPVVSGSMSAVAMSLDYIRKEAEAIGLDLSPGELRLIRRLSREYAGESQKATKQGCPAPWQIPGTKAEPSALQLSMREAAAQ